LHMKDLALVNPEEGIPLRSFLSFYGRPIPKIRADRTLDFVLNEFKSGKSHIAIVQRYDGANSNNENNIGIATLEDVLEEILQDEIMDEDDVSGSQPSRQFRDAVLKSSQQLSQQQLKAIQSYLSTTLPEFSPSLLGEDAFKYLVSKSEVIHIEKPLKSDEPVYQRNQPSSWFTLVLQGKIEIQSGAEGFRSEGGPFTYLGLAALKSDSFIPDFTAKILTHAQILRIKKRQYDDAVRVNQSITGAKKIPPAPPMIRAEPKTFMESTDFPERRRGGEREGKARGSVNIALKDMGVALKEIKKPSKEEKVSLMEATDEDLPESPLSTSTNAVVNSAVESINNALV